DFEGEARSDVAQERLARLPADVDRRDDLIDGPALGFTHELVGAVGLDQKTVRRAGLGQEQIAAVEPVGVDQAFRLLALQTIGAAEQRAYALGFLLGGERERLRASRIGAGVGARRKADDLATREQGGRD